jgi:uncharacterized protein YndB with AHSA1/START domain
MESVVVIRRVEASPEVVFAAWTDAGRMARWWWPQLACTTYDVDARPGGRYRIHGRAIGATVSGVYAAVDPPRRLAFTWVWSEEGSEPHAGDDPADDVVVTFEQDGSATVVTVTHTLAAAGDGGDLRQGWTDVLDRLVRCDLG